ncbi:MAG: nicotinamide-nucleotide amidohydrolase family protein [Beijerinckiaceae bacterium]|nr:nicotinamide-nucleotide amidohydrolase family protein [Beijerinckiaceae bacterium]
MTTPLNDAAKQTFKLAAERRLRIATAESCTGGMVAMALTDIAGASDIVERGFVTYSNKAKTDMLGVSERLISSEGAVAASVAAAMAEGALTRSEADIAVAITGIAGPGGSTEHKPVGLVFIAAAMKNGRVDAQEFRFGNIGRGAVRERSAIEALNMMSRLMQESETA